MKISKVVVFCGSQSPIRKHNQLAYQTGKALATNGFITVTGGGSGLMEQVNKGAHDAGGQSHGLSVDSSEIEPINGFLHYSKRFKTFTARHDALLLYGDAYLALPGGLGTILEIVDITQKKKFHDVPPERPLILIGDYFEDLHNVFSNIAKLGYITDDLNSFYSHVNTVEEMTQVLMKK